MKKIRFWHVLYGLSILFALPFVAYALTWIFTGYSPGESVWMRTIAAATIGFLLLPIGLDIDTNHYDR